MKLNESMCGRINACSACNPFTKRMSYQMTLYTVFIKVIKHGTTNEQGSDETRKELLFVDLPQQNLSS